MESLWSEHHRCKHFFQSHRDVWFIETPYFIDFTLSYINQFQGQLSLWYSCLLYTISVLERFDCNSTPLWRWSMISYQKHIVPWYQVVFSPLKDLSPIHALVCFHTINHTTTTPLLAFLKQIPPPLNFQVVEKRNWFLFFLRKTFK